MISHDFIDYDPSGLVSEDGYALLKAAIFNQAVIDLQNEKYREEVMNFFRSAWCKELLPEIICHRQLVRELNELQVKRFIVKPRKRRPDREKLRAARKRCGFDQRTVARVLHVGQPMVSGWENGEGISRKNLQKLARLYLVEVSELLED